MESASYLLDSILFKFGKFVSCVLSCDLALSAREVRVRL